MNDGRLADDLFTLTAFTADERNDEVLDKVQTGHDLLRVEEKAIGAHH